jgi:hypothetical protein
VNERANVTVDGPTAGFVSTPNLRDYMKMFVRVVVGVYQKLAT